MTQTAYRVNVFGAQPETGNPAVVVVGADERPESMQALAAKAAVSDTAFVWPAEAPHRFRIRWFTPTTEVTLCGHATLAAARVIRETGAIDPQQAVEFQSARDRLIVTQEGELGWLELPLPTLTTVDLPRKTIANALQIWDSETDFKFPLVVTPERDLIIPLSEAGEIYQIEPDQELLAQLGREYNVRGFCLLGRQKRDAASHFSLRFFAPHYGIPEDPATGSVVGPLALYALKHGWAKGGSDPIRLRFEQGDAIGRPCRLLVEITGDPPTRLRVGGLTSAPVAQQL
jgi:PhzF family phenazine biosynthesis protein